MNVDLNSSLPYVNISDLMAHISKIDNNSEKVEKLKNYVDVLNAELMKIKDSKCDSPLCIIILTGAIGKLEKEILRYTDMTPNAVTKEFMPLKGGELKRMDMLEKSSDADKKNWMSFIQLGNNNVADKNSDITKQGYASHGSSSGLMRENVATYENPYSQMSNNFNNGKRSFLQFQRPSGVIIRENPNINNADGKRPFMQFQRPSGVIIRENPNINNADGKRPFMQFQRPSGMIIRENPNINNADGKRPFLQFQRPSGVIIRENPNINNAQQHSSVGGVGLSSFNMNYSGSFATNSSYQPSASSFLIDPSKKPRISWTQNLHDAFLQVVDNLGGPYAATPKKIREQMRIHNLTNDEVKSHLQKYRLHLEKLATSTPASVGPSSSRSSLTGQGNQANMFTGTVSEYSAHSSGGPLHTRRVRITGDDNGGNNAQDHKSEGRN